MKKIEAIIVPFKLDNVREVLNAKDMCDIVVSEVEACDERHPRHEIWAAREYLRDLIPKLKLEFEVSDDEALPASQAIVKAAWTRTAGDPEITILPLDKVVTIRAEAA